MKKNCFELLFVDFRMNNRHFHRLNREKEAIEENVRATMNCDILRTEDADPGPQLDFSEHIRKAS